MTDLEQVSRQNSKS